MGGSVVEEALQLLRAHYIFPATAERAAESVRAAADAGAYEGLDEPALASALTEHLATVCGDAHLRVRPRRPGYEAAVSRAEQRAAWQEELRLGAYGIARVERLDGNVGYLDLRMVAPPDVGGRAVAAAMELVTHTCALIVDLRRNGGGSPAGVTFWNSWFFPDDETHLNDIEEGGTGRIRQYWTLPHLPGERYLDRPVWILTSGATFSAAEEFCYNLQAQCRATLVGETTRGGAHPTQSFRLTDTLEITIPIARSVNPVTGTNWEGTGVRPDVQSPADEAFAVAYRAALAHVLEHAEEATVLAEARAAQETS